MGSPPKLIVADHKTRFLSPIVIKTNILWKQIDQLKNSYEPSPIGDVLTKLNIFSDFKSAKDWPFPGSKGIPSSDSLGPGLRETPLHPLPKLIWFIDKDNNI